MPGPGACCHGCGAAAPGLGPGGRGGARGGLGPPGGPTPDGLSAPAQRVRQRFYKKKEFSVRRTIRGIALRIRLGLAKSQGITSCAASLWIHIRHVTACDRHLILRDLAAAWTGAVPHSGLRCERLHDSLFAVTSSFGFGAKALSHCVTDQRSAKHAPSLMFMGTGCSLHKVMLRFLHSAACPP